MSKKIEIIQKLQRGEVLTKEEIDFISYNINKGVSYGLVWEDHPEDVDLELKDGVFKIKEIEDKRIKNNPEGVENLLLEGDNLHSLMALKEAGIKVDVIYIDPPYNTLNEIGFRYNDKKIDSNDNYRHSKWLSFMYKRLELARDLMEDDGVIFVSIDENEQANLKLLMDQVFGEKNFITEFVWIAAKTRIEELEDNEKLKTLGANLGMFKSSHESILCYRKTLKHKFNLISSDNNFIYSRITKNGNKVSKIIIPKGTNAEIKNAKFNGYIGGKSEPIEICNNDDLIIENYKVKNDVLLKSCFANPLMVKSFFEGKEVIDNRGQKILDIYITKTGLPYMKKDKKGEIPINVFSGYGDTSDSSKEIESILGDKKNFNHPKPKGLIKDILKISSNKESIILDFFAGSGTTGQAVMELNKEDGGNRRFILCTNNENNICEEVTYERNKRVITGEYAKEKVDPLPNNLSYYKVNIENKDNLSYKEKLQLENKSLKHFILWKEDAEILEENNKCITFSNNKEKILLILSKTIDEEIKDMINNNKFDKIYTYKYLSRDKAFLGINEEVLIFI